MPRKRIISAAVKTPRPLIKSGARRFLDRYRMMLVRLSTPTPKRAALPSLLMAVRSKEFFTPTIKSISPRLSSAITTAKIRPPLQSQRHDEPIAGIRLLAVAVVDEQELGLLNYAPEFQINYGDGSRF